jgi:signal transduction histidine kinase/ligand-binding sensor domain-containing protein
MKLLLLLIFCSNYFFSSAQSNHFTFNNYTVDNGLCDNYINSIFQDSRGFIWFGTAEGMSRFDGANFKNFYANTKDSTALYGNNVSNISEYKKGHLVFNSNGTVRGLNTYSSQFYAFPSLKNKNGYIIKGLSNNVWFFCGSDTCYVLDSSMTIVDTIITNFKTKAKSTLVLCSQLDNEKYLLNNGIEYVIYYPESKKIITLNLDKSTFNDPDYALNFRYYDPANNWLYVNNYFAGLYRYNLQGKLLMHWAPGLNKNNLGGGSIMHILPVEKKYLWLGMQEGGLNILNTETNIVEKYRFDTNNPNSLASDVVTQIYKDKENNFWMATTKGVSKLNQTTFLLKNWKNEFDNTSALLSVKNDANSDAYVTFFSTKNVYKINNETDIVTKLDASKFPQVWASSKSNNELIFSGIGNSVTYYNPQNNSYRVTDFLKNYFPTSEIVILNYTAKNGDRWFSGNKGGGLLRIASGDGSYHLYKKDGPKGKFTTTYFASYTETANGDMWFGVNKTHKLLHWDSKKDTLTEIDWREVEGMRDAIVAGIVDLQTDRDDNVWVAFGGSGIGKYNYRENKSKLYTIQDGLISNGVYALQFDGKNRLWIGTLKGVSCFIVNENKFVNFSKKDGFVDDYISNSSISYDSINNKIWVGAEHTLYKFTPDELLSFNNKNFPIYIDEIIVNGKKNIDTIYNNLSLRANQNNIQFSFIGIDANSGMDLEYSYKLEGADKDWVFNGHTSTASYANLSSGKYTFKVRARHKGDNEWKETEDPLTFTIATPWNKTWWFYLLMGLAILGFALWLNRAYYLRKLEKQKAIVEKQEAIQEERNRIAADMHDDLGSGLTKITYLSQMAMSSENKENDLLKINKTSAELVESMSEIIWAMKEENNSIEDLIFYIKSCAVEYCTNNNLECTIILPENIKPRIVKGQNRRHIFLAIKETLHNIVKHAQATEVLISIVFNTQWIVKIQDNGRGIDVEKASNRLGGNGLHNIKKRIHAVNGTVSIENNNGTLVTLYIPG